MFPEELSTWLRENKLGLALVFIGFVLLGCGVWWIRNNGNKDQEVKILSAETEAVVKVDVEGSVARPGVYELTGGRVGDALDQAGGLSESADVDWVNKNLNKAAKVTDGMKVYVPAKQGHSNEPQMANQPQNSDLIDVNSASVAELDKLPGIGEVTANKIISGRPYSSVDELLSKKVVGQKVFDQIKEKISVW